MLCQRDIQDVRFVIEVILMYGLLLDDSGEKVLTINKGQEVFIGREDFDGSGICVEDECVSRRHASIKFDKEFCLKDLNSKNGSYINGELMKSGEALMLTDGDVLRFGNSEFRFRISKPERAENIYGGYTCSIKNSAGGRRFRIELKERGCIDYQLRMIEENPQLYIAEIIHVKNIENDCILCDIGGCLNLTEYIKQYRKNINAVEFVENLLRTVKTGEEHLLDRKRYIIHPETVFLDRNEKLRLIYVPDVGENQDMFSIEMRDMCRYLSKLCIGKDKEDILKLGEMFENSTLNTIDYIKQLYGYKDIGSGLDKMEGENMKIMNLQTVKYGITLASFLVFMLVFWIGVGSFAGTAVSFVVLAAVNIFIYKMPGNLNERIDMFITSHSYKN